MEQLEQVVYGIDDPNQQLEIQLNRFHELKKKVDADSVTRESLSLSLTQDVLIERLTSLEQLIRELSLQNVSSPSHDYDVASEKQIKILFLAANTLDATHLRLDKEVKEIEDTLRKAQFRDKFDFKQQWAVRVTDLQEYLLYHKPHIVHFSGHGSQLSEIILEDNDGTSYPVPPHALSKLFLTLKDNIRCVILTACYSEKQAQAIAEHIDCVIGMSKAISDSAATSFSSAFYQALAFGRSVKTAFELGCIQIELENRDEFHIPELISPEVDPNTVIFTDRVVPQEVDNMPDSYVDFDLHIGPNGHVVASSVLEGQATADISTEVPGTVALLLDSINKRQVNADMLKLVGETLYDWLFPGPIHTHFQQTEAVARRDDTKMRLRLRIEAEEIASLPLEFLYRKIGGYYIAVNPDTVLSRYLNLAMPPRYVRRREEPLHMLAIIADPTDQTRLPPDEWEAIIQEALAEPLATSQMTLQTVKRATRKEIRDALLKQKPDIIQFVGHGIYKDGKGHLALVEEKTGKTWLADDERFANLYLGHDDNLGLISLATCESAKSDDPQGFLGIAPKLVQRGVPAVLAMQYKVYVKTAKVFLEDFYTSVAARKPIDWATQSARNAISLEYGPDNREFATPVLYMRAKDGIVF